MTVVCIVGMHRSGTSALAGSLQQRGVYLGHVFEWNPHNQKGNRENAEIMQLNNNILAYNQASWDNPPGLIIWTREYEEARDKIINGFLESKHQVWGFKDPRTLFTLGFWLEGLKNMNVKFIGSFRHPIAVVNSLRHRDNMPYEKGFALWDEYNTQLLGLQQKHEFPLVSYDVDASEYQRSLDRVLLILDLPLNLKVEEQFFDNSLRHENTGNLLEIPSDVMVLYSQLLHIYKDQAQ